MPSKVSHESTEDYLETILILQKRNHVVRSIDIVNEMNFSKPSISIAQNGHISLLPPGREIAERIYARHELLTRVLNAIGVEEPVASDEACRIEHVIDDDTYNKINAFYEKFMKEQA